MDKEDIVCTHRMEYYSGIKEEQHFSHLEHEWT